MAKSKIKEYFAEVADESKVKEGKKILQKEFDLSGLGLVANFNFKKLIEALNSNLNKDYKNMHNIFIAIGEGNLKSVDVVKSLSNKNYDGIKVNLKIVAKNRFGLLKDIYDILYRYSVDMYYLKGYASKKEEEAYFSVQIVVDDIENIEKLFHELEKMDGFKYVQRVSYVGVYFTYLFAIFTIALWVLHPLLIPFVADIPIAKNSAFFFNAILDFGLFILFLCVFYLTNITKKFFPIVRNKKMFLAFSMGMPILASMLLLCELFYLDLDLSWITLTIEIVMIYVYLGFSFVNFRKYLN